MVDLLLAKTIALDFTNLQTLNANNKFLSWLEVGFFLETIFNFLIMFLLSISCTKNAFSKKR